jgi:hypothetical protein
MLQRRFMNRLVSVAISLHSDNDSVEVVADGFLLIVDQDDNTDLDCVPPTLYTPKEQLF